MIRILVLTFSIFGLSTTAQAFIASNGLLVEDAAGGDFRVPYRGLSAASDFWCAAGDYVVRDLGLPPDTRVFRTSSPPRRGGDGMTFSLSPSNAKKSGLGLFSNSRGLTAAHARQLCNDRRNILD